MSLLSSSAGAITMLAVALLTIAVLSAIHVTSAKNDENTNTNNDNNGNLIGSSLSSLGNDLANSIIGLVKQKAKQGCDNSGSSGNTQILTSDGSGFSSSSSSSSSGMISSSVSGDGQGQTVVSSSGGGRMVICGSLGNDILNGGSGADNISGGTGDDKLFGGPGNDILIGGPGADYFDCGPGTDTIRDFNPSEGDTKTNDCENAINANQRTTSTSAATNTASQSFGAQGAIKPATTPGSTTTTQHSNAIAPSSTTTGHNNPIVPALPQSSTAVGSGAVPTAKKSNTTTHSATIIPSNQSKITNKTSAIHEAKTLYGQPQKANETAIPKTVINRPTTAHTAIKPASIGFVPPRQISMHNTPRSEIIEKIGVHEPLAEFSHTMNNIKEDKVTV